MLSPSHAAAFLGVTLVAVFFFMYLPNNDNAVLRVRRAVREQQGADVVLAVPGDGSAMLPRVSLRGKLPEGFNWRVYQLFHPELNLTSERQVARHYLRHGRQEGRCFKAVPVVMRYPASSGLTNQLYAHLISLAIATSVASHGVPVEVVVPDGQKRQTFAQGHGFSAVPTTTILDVKSMAAHWWPRGILITQGKGRAGCQDFYIPQPPLFRPMADMVSLLGSNLKEASCRPSEPPPCVQFTFDKMLYIVNGSSALPEMSASGRGMFFNVSVVNASAAVLERLPGAGAEGFSGAHLRVENDWTQYGREGKLESYIKLMQKAGYNSSSTLYVASGIFSYWGKARIKALEQQLIEAGVCSRIAFKERILGPMELQGFHTEQLALIDLLVLARASPVVGSPSSTLSWYVRELRGISGLPTSTFHMINPKDRDWKWAEYNKQGVLRFAP